MRPIRLLLVSVCFLLILMSACVPLKTTNTEQNLNRRITEIMDAKVAGDWFKVYNYFDEEYRKKVTHSSFVNRSRLMFTGYTIENIVIDTDKKSAKAQLTINFSSRGYEFNGVKETQLWIFEHGNWYQRVPSKSMKSIFGT